MTKVVIPWFRPYFDGEELREVINSFENDWLTMGEKVEKFEKRLAEFVEVPFAIAVSNGTTALDLALKTIGIEPGDEVIVPAMTYFATASAISYQKAIPVFVDIDPLTFNLNPLKIEKAITDNTKAIVFIDYGGNAAGFDEFREIGEKLKKDSGQLLSVSDLF